MDLNVQLSDADGGLVLCISGSDWNAQKKKSMELCCNAYITWGTIFHVFWEANPKYSICFMGAMMFMMVTGIENLCEEKSKNKNKRFQLGMLCYVWVE